MRLLDLSGVPDLPVPLEVLRLLHDRALRNRSRMLVIGAAARDLVVHAPSASQSPRATLDIDVAIAVDRAGFEAFTHELERVRRSEHKFLVLGIEVDIVPYGPIESARAVVFDDGHKLDLTGLAEAAKAPVEVRLPGDLRLDVASLPAQAALKVLAWRDRHLDNPKDGKDLGEILQAAAHDPYVEAVWQDARALEHGEYDIYVASAFHVGRAAARPFAAEHGRSVIAVLEDPMLVDRLARHMGGVLSRGLLAAFAAGFRDGLDL